MFVKKREKITIKKVYERIRGELDKKNKLLILLSIVNVVIYAYFSSLIPISINCLINTVEENKDVLFYFSLLISFFLISRITRELQMVIFGPLSQKLLKILSLKSFENVIRRQNGYNNSNNLGRLLQVISNGENSFVVVAERIYYLVLPLFLEVAISSMLLLFNFGFKYCVFVFFIVISYLITVLKLTDAVRPLHKHAIDETLTTRSRIHDYLKNQQLVNNYHIQEIVSQRLSKQLDNQIRKFITFFNRRGLSGIVQSVVLVFGIGIINYVALLDYQSGSIEIGFFAAINLYILQFIKPFEEMGLALREIRFSLNNLYLYIRSTLASKSEGLGIEVFSKPISTIQINNVHFEVPNKKILADISLNLCRGEKVAIVGKTGEGKSTLCKIMSGLLKPTDGFIVVNGNPLSSHHHMQEYKILYVTQETLLFDENIEFNIFFDHARANEDSKKHLFKDYQDFFDKNDIKQNVGSLSGGQKQLVSFLRAIAHKPDVILFDEVNSSQDFKSYSQIINYILRLKDTAVIFVTHRLEMIEQFDKTYIINNKKPKSRFKLIFD